MIAKLTVPSVLLLPLWLVAVGGCYYDGSASDAGRGADYARSVRSLYDQPRDGAPPANAALRFPLGLAVAEVGEVSPQPALMETLRPQGQWFTRVEGIPAQEDADGPARDPGGFKPSGGAGPGMVQRLTQLARGMGLDYVLLFGATVEADAHPTEFSALDLTIVGAYAVPSWHLTGQARASAVLVDVRTNRVVLTAGSESKAKRSATGATEQWRVAHLSRDLRDDAFRKLGGQIVDEFGRRAKAVGGAAPVPAPAAVAVPTADPFAPSANLKSVAPAPYVTSEPRPAPSAGPLPPDPIPARRR